MNLNRDYWLPRYDVSPLRFQGAEWPALIIVDKWEENGIGERRFVETRSYPLSQREPKDIEDEARKDERDRIWRQIQPVLAGLSAYEQLPSLLTILNAFGRSVAEFT